ncbi:glycosyltransferase family 2 protein [Williamsia sp. 1135]|uniref:glycosyltransferase family 2 protein n=1 Tax=Williamsia sp. 1135 TaxID=1889262 RepID=UPI000A104062|nr:glycosyltransferase family 2 protein [Williamsia sp. 1135]ORM25996.1 glycosyl transferase [Williamsia sp. 1135]
MDSKCLSVVVPTFNEEEVIGECLERLSRQLDYILEIVVVDNNSTDKTADIVATFTERHPEIRMISETRQGLVFARNAGLDASGGPAVARIDSDTLVPPHWARTIVEFLQSDTEHRWAALCGRGEAYGLPYGEALKGVKERISPLRARRVNTTRAGIPTPIEVKDVPVLYGSNMVLRRETWLQIRERVSLRRDLFEDVDTGLCVQESGGRNAFLPDITVGVSPRRMETSVPAFLTYMICLPRTLLVHRRFGWAALAALVYLPMVTALHAVRLVVIRAYDKETGEFAAKNMLRPTHDRIMP